MTLFSLDELRQTQSVLKQFVPPTPAYAWPLLARRTGLQVIVKHENHTPTGAFKARSVLAYVDNLKATSKLPAGLATATRGNHGQAVAIAAANYGLSSVIIVPEGNSVEKNAAMRAWGGEVVIAGRDFEESRSVAADIAETRGYHFVPSFHPLIVRGVATYALELFEAVRDIDVVYVPIGMGSGICGLIAVRDLLGLSTEIVGVVAENAPAFALSFEAGGPVATETARTFADGIATRQPQKEAMDIILSGAARIVTVSDDAIAEAMRILFADTHNVAEGAGAAPLAGLLAEKERYASGRAAIILCGGNVDTEIFAQVLSGVTPAVE